MGGACEVELFDTRSMLRHDGWTYLCGHCVSGTYHDQRFRLLAVKPSKDWAVVIDRNLTLEEASWDIGRVRGLDACFAII